MIENNFCFVKLLALALTNLGPGLDTKFSKSNHHKIILDTSRAWNELGKKILRNFWFLVNFIRPTGPIVDSHHGHQVHRWFFFSS